MTDILNTSRQHRLDEARHLFQEMRRLLTVILEDDEIPCHIGMDLGDEINGVLERAAKVSF